MASAFRASKNAFCLCLNVFVSDLIQRAGNVDHSLWGERTVSLLKVQCLILTIINSIPIYFFQKVEILSTSIISFCFSLAYLRAVK